VVGRLFSLLFSIIMIGSALAIHYSRQGKAIEDLQLMLLSILGGGLLGLFLLGFLTRRVDSRAALIATVITVVGVAVWLLLGSPLGASMFPTIAAYVPNKFWVGVFANVALFGIGYGVSYLLGSRSQYDRMKGLTVWER